MWVADSCPAEMKGRIPDRDRLLQDLSGRSGNGDVRAPKADLPHLHLNPLPIVQHEALNQTSLGLDAEGFVGNQLPVPQIAAKDAQTIAAFFSLAAIGIEDTQPKRCFLRGQWA